MGQKINPIGVRLKINRTWDSMWFAKKENYTNEQIIKDNNIKESGKVCVLRLIHFYEINQARYFVNL